MEEPLPWPEGGFEQTAVETHLDVLLLNYEAFSSQEEEIVTAFGGKEYFAIRNRIIIGHGPDKAELRRRFPGKGVYIGSVAEDGTKHRTYMGEITAHVA
jgi:hypothetical protein